MNFILVEPFVAVLIFLFFFIGGILIVSQLQWKSFVSSLDKAMAIYSCLR
jgi:hypothetical protein